MTFLILLCCLVAERYLLGYQQLRQPLWLERWLEWQQSLPVAESLRVGSLGLAGVLLPPLLLVAFIQWTLSDSLVGIPGALFTALVLLYSLGPTDLDSQVQDLSNAMKSGDTNRLEAAAMHLVDDIPPNLRDPGFFRSLAEAILIQAHSRIFAVLVWFLLLGPVGALGYRLASEINHLALYQSREGLETPAQGLLFVLDWLPARLLAGLFALAGSFEDTVQGWRNCDPERYADPGKALVLCAGSGALRLDSTPSVEDLRDRADPVLPSTAMGLVWRALVLFVALLGLITLSGWIL
jgi:membrane protein required for beta-lactamase induction